MIANHLVPKGISFEYYFFRRTLASAQLCLYTESMKKWLDRCVDIYEYFIAFLFLKGAWNIARADVVSPAIKYLTPLTGQAAIYIYAILCGVLGVGLVVAKIFKLRSIHGYVLMGMYLLAFYIVTLSLLVSDWTNGMILSIFYTLSIAVLYLYWRYKVIYNELNATDKE